MAPACDPSELAQEDLGHVIYAIGITADFRVRPHDTVEAHVCFLNRLLASTRFQSFLYLSSTRVYGNGPTGEEVSIVTSPANPDHLYNLTKLTGECLCLTHTDVHTRVVRLSNVYGDDYSSPNFLASILQAAVKGEVVFRTSIDSSKDYIAVKEVAKLLVGIALEGRERIYNVASGCNVSNGDLAQAITAISGARVCFLQNAPRVSYGPIDTTRIQNEFAYQATGFIEQLPGLLSTWRNLNDSH
jgi:nucleoside-diphosphate-sugar epimerase